MSDEYADESTMSEDEIILTPDFSDALDMSPVPEGEYPVQITKVQGPVWPKGTSADNPFKENGDPAYPMLVVYTEVINMPGFENRRLVPWRGALAGEYAGFLLEALKAFDPSYEKGQPINKQAMVGQTAVAVVEETTYEGRQSNNIARFKPLA